MSWKKLRKLNHHQHQKKYEQQTEVDDLLYPWFNDTSKPQPPSKSLNSSIEEFDVIDANEKQSRTFSFISDFIDRLTPGCVFPCTIDAFRQNRCCEVIIPPPPVCCQPPPPPPPPILPPRPIPLPLPPQRPPPVIIPPRYPPIGCCSTCNIYAYYGPPPCIRYGIGSFGTGSLLDSIGGIFDNTPRVTIQIPPNYVG